jgi:tRNA pseudouridine13 synthase
MHPDPPERDASPSALPGLSRAWCERVLAPSLVTADLPGVGGRLRAALEDFRVDEIPAYPPDGREGHLFTLLEKRGLSTEDAIGALARALGVDAREIGFAGRKDAAAVTRQWISVPAHAAPALASFEHEAIVLFSAQPHSHKLKIGHLRGNRFDIAIRDLAVAPELALARARAKLDRILAASNPALRGIPNSFGPQRFRHGAEGIARGLAALARGKGGARANMTVAAGQAALFNLWIELRCDRDLFATVLEGDVLAKVGTGGLFTSTDPIVDGERLARGEVAITGPMFGSRTMSPPPGTAAAALDSEVLALAGVRAEALHALRRAALGTRRRMLVCPTDVELELLRDDLSARDRDDVDASPGLRLRFTLAAGSFATQLFRELAS